MIRAEKLSNFTLDRRMYESPQKYAAAVAHYSHYLLVLAQLLPRSTCFKRVNLKLRPVIDCQHRTKLASLAFIPEASKYFIE
jgi:hypothetical protein